MNASTAVSCLAALAAGLIATFPLQASEPASHDLALPTVPGQQLVIEWTGTALPGGSGLGTTGGVADAPQPCPPVGADDAHTINLSVPDGIYDTLNVNADFHVEWEGGEPDPSGTFTDPDLVLAVYQDMTTLVGYSDGGSPEENVGASNLAAGSYTAVVCPFLASAPTPYRGRLTLTVLEPLACVTGAPRAALAHSTAPSSFGGLKDQERSGLAAFDAFRSEVAAIARAVPSFSDRHQAPLFDRTLGVPTFLWARRDAVPPPVGALGSERELLVARARAHLKSEARALGLSAAMIDGAEVFDAQFNGNGPAVVRLRQRVDGVPVHHRTLNVLLDRAHRPIAVSGYFARHAAGTGPAFARSAAEAVAAAWGNLGGTLSADALAVAETRGEWQWFNRPALAGSHVWERAPRARRVWYPRATAAGLEPAWEVELFAKARVIDQLIAYSYVISAVDGRVLHRQNLKTDAAYSYRVFADIRPPLYTPHDSPLGNGYTPFTGATPSQVLARSGVATSLVTLEHAGIVTGDPWLADGATETVGNHVDACLDVVDTPVSGVISNPTNTCNPELGDSRPAPTGNSFDYAIEPDENPANPNAQAAAVVNLFYMNNWLHDWWYNHGFDEVSGNAQSSNYGRGGEEGDPIKAQGQDASGRNNANMATPTDGSSPTMQQYLFDGPANGEVRVTAPADSGPLKFAAAGFGPDDYDLSAPIVLADDGMGVSPSDGCGEQIPDPGLPVAPPTVPAAPQASLSGAIALIDRGNCNFTVKAQFALASGAVGMIVVNNADTDPIVMGNADIPVSQVPVQPTDALYEIPAVMIRKDAGALIKAQLASGAVSGRMQRTPSQDIDGTLDNQIIAHEYFHYVHHRLTDSSSQQTGAMSEGWGDIDSFMFGLRADDAQLAGNERFQGAYGMAGYVVNNFYLGIRRAPYSTDFARNGFTFKHIGDGEPTPDGGPGTNNSEVHNAGEIWANMMFECYVGLLTDPRHSFTEAQSRMQDYIIGGLKMTPADATYTEARDAVLSVVLATDFEDYRRCSHGFAKRGAGLNAVAPGRSSTDLTGVVEDYSEFVCGFGAGGGPVETLVPSADRERFGGGALGAWLLLPLLGASWLRRRRAGCGLRR